MGRCSRSLSSPERRRRRARPFRERFEHPGHAVDPFPPVREGLVEAAIVDVEVHEVARQALGVTQLHIDEVVDAACVGNRVESVDGAELLPSDMRSVIVQHGR